MQGISLKNFQIDTVNKLLDATSVGTKREVLVSTYWIWQNYNITFLY